MHFEKYSKIRRLGDAENDGILKGDVWIQEKLDGANASIWMGDDGNIHYGSRNGAMGYIETSNGQVIGDNFRGLGTWLAGFAEENDELYDILRDGDRIYGEWLVTHKVVYKPEYLNCFYGYDIVRDGEFLGTELVYKLFNEIQMLGVPCHGYITDPTVEGLKELVGQSDMAVTRGEGIVLKNAAFINKFGRPSHAKFVCEKFQENNGAKVKSPRDYGDIDGTVDAVLEAFVTEARIDKLMHKIHDETGETASAKWTGRILGQHWQDLWNEEAHGIMKLVGANDFNFRRLKTKHDVAVRETFFKIMQENAK